MVSIIFYYKGVGGEYQNILSNIKWQKGVQTSHSLDTLSKSREKKSGSPSAHPENQFLLREIGQTLLKKIMSLKILPFPFFQIAAWNLLLS